MFDFVIKAGQHNYENPATDSEKVFHASSKPIPSQFSKQELLPLPGNTRNTRMVNSARIR